MGKQSVVRAKRAARLSSSAPYTTQQQAVVTKVFVGNLAYQTTWQSLKDHMKTAGSVIRAEILENKDGTSKGCGIVQFSDVKSANRAISLLNNSELDGYEIFVREDRESSESNEVYPKVYLGNLSWGVNWMTLKDFLKTHCDGVVHVDVAMDGDRSKGYAIADFSSAAAASDCISRLNGVELDGRALYVQKYRESDTTATVQPHSTVNLRRLFIGNLAWNVDWRMLKVHLGSVGEVRVDVAMEGDKSKGYAIAEFATEHAAAVCIRQFNDTEFHGRVLNIREDREADVNQQHSSSGNVVGHTHSERIVSLYTAGSSKRNGNAGCRLFVNNLSWDVAWQDLKDHFKRCGDVIRADVAREEGSNRSRGHGFIEYADSDAADAAIRTLNNSILNGREIFVRKDRDE